MAIPAGVKVTVADGRVSVTGRKGTLTRAIHERVAIEVQGDRAVVSLRAGGAGGGNLFGLYRTLLANMVKGVSEGFTKTLDIVGVGYKAEVKKGAIQLVLGYSHPILFPLPDGISA
ncbi:MAG: 50S ribosomal protein L6, partial [Gemmatimonadota bacterium]